MCRDIVHVYSESKQNWNASLESIGELVYKIDFDWLI